MLPRPQCRIHHSSRKEVGWLLPLLIWLCRSEDPQDPSHRLTFILIFPHFCRRLTKRRKGPQVPNSRLLYKRLISPGN